MELVTMAKNPVPSGARVGMFKSYDGTSLRFAIWEASRGPKRGTVCLFHGRTEFIEKYFEVVADLRRRGLAVATMDWRGQGGSERKLRNHRKGYVKSFSQYDNDLIRFMRDIVLPDCPPPFTALAHSTGGNILIRAACNSGSWFDRIVLTAPMVSLEEASLPVALGSIRTITEVATGLGFGHLYVPGASDKGWEADPFEGNVLTSSEERYERNRAIVKAAPALGLGGPTMAWMRSALRSMEFIGDPNFAPKVHVPLFIVAAADDKIVSTRAIEEFSARTKVASHIVLPHARHEILQEREDIRRQFWAAFDAYIGVNQIAAA